MTRPYPCFMTVYFRPELGLPKLMLEFFVQDEAKAARRILLQLPGGQTIAEKQLAIDADPPRNVWIRFDGSGRSSVSASSEHFLAAATGVVTGSRLAAESGDSLAPTSSTNGSCGPKG